MKLVLQAAIDGKLDEQLNLALCEWKGLNCYEYQVECALDTGNHTSLWVYGTLGGAKKCLFRVEGTPIIKRVRRGLPNHITAPESLGLVHEVEKTLPEHHGYIGNLKRVCEGGVARCIVATARQRVIAILLTVSPTFFTS